VALWRVVCPRTVVPVHYEGWSHIREGRAAIDAAVASAGPALRDSFRVVTIGEPTELEV
jgi:hypothetical protein